MNDKEVLGALVERRDRDAVAEHVVDPAQLHRCGSISRLLARNPQIMAGQRLRHDAVFAERDRARVAVNGLVMDRQERHRQTIIDSGMHNLARTLLNSRSMCHFNRQCFGENALNHTVDTALLLGAEDVPPVREYREAGRSPFLLTCDHYGRLISRKLGDLGLPESELTRHIAWDIGIAGVAEALSEQLDAHLIVQRYSRLVIDCNPSARCRQFDFAHQRGDDRSGQ